MELLRAHHQETGEHRDVAGGVHCETHAGACSGDDDAAECRPEDPRAVEDARVETDRVRQFDRADHAEGQLLTGWGVEDLNEAHERCDHVDVPRAGDSRKRDDGDRGGEDHLRQLRADNGSPGVEPVDDDAGDQAEERERHELAERENPDRDRRVSQREDEPGLRDALHPRADVRNDLAREEQAIVAVLPDAEEGARAGAKDRRRHDSSSASRCASGSIAASIASSSSGSSSRSRAESQAVRFDLTKRRTFWPAEVSVSPTRLWSPSTGALWTRPASSRREMNLDMPGTDIRSKAASSRIPIPGRHLIWTSSDTWPPVTPSEWTSRLSCLLSCRRTGRSRFARTVGSAAMTVGIR